MITAARPQPSPWCRERWRRSAQTAGGLTATDLRPGRTQWVAPGIVHDVRNVAALPAVSIHAYSPPLSSMTYYRQDWDRLVPVKTVTGREPEAS